MDIPQDVLDAVTAVQAASDAELAAVMAKALTGKALSDAQTADQSAQQAVDSGKAEQSAKLDALVKLLTDRYGQAAAEPAQALRQHFAERHDLKGAAAAQVNWSNWLGILIQILEVVSKNLPAQQQQESKR
jgi:hypothetical protein